MTRMMSGQTLARLRLYLYRQASNVPRYVLEQTVLSIFGWIPTLVGVSLRAIAYRVVMRMDGLAAIEAGVRIRFAKNITLRQGAYIDERVYLHACPGGIHVGKASLVMHGSVLHVYNFRDIPHSGIWIGEESLIGEYNVIRGQGGVRIGNRVYTSPNVQIVAVNHLYSDRDRPFVYQGITAEGIVIEDDVWIGSGAIVTDGVKIGKGSVVAAGSVVTRDVRPHTVVAGAPARVIREIGDSEQARRDTKVFFREEDYDWESSERDRDSQDGGERN